MVNKVEAHAVDVDIRAEGDRVMAAGDITQEHIDKAAEAFNANGQPS